MLNIAILGSTNGTNVLPLAQKLHEEKINAKICVIGSDNKDAGILQKAKLYGCPHFFIERNNLSKKEFHEQIHQKLLEHNVHIVLLIGYMRILSESFVNKWEHRIFNVHPSLLPLFAGKMDLSVHDEVIKSGFKESGCSVHEVIAKVDAGKIIVQKKCVVLKNETPESLKQKVQKLEVIALTEAIQQFDQNILPNQFI